MNIKNILDEIDCYYTQKIEEFGPVPQGVDWNSEHGQLLRFQKLCNILDGDVEYSLNDVGCGYGSLLKIAMTDKLKKYNGFDLSDKMIEIARKNYMQNSKVSFYRGEINEIADYSIASGIFNVKFENKESDWLEYIFKTLDKMNHFSSKGFSFNFLTSYSDAHRKRNDLYYADPCMIFDYCLRKFSRKVSLLHDYDLFEFTILVKKV